MIEYHVETECGRNFCWSALDMDHLFRTLLYNGYRATRVMLQSEWEAEQDEIREIRKKLEAMENAGSAA